MALFSKIEEFKKHTDEAIGPYIDSLLPIVPDVYRKYIAAYLPANLYKKLDELDESSELPEDATYLALRLLLQNAMAKLCIAEYAVRSEVSLTTSGLQRTEGSEQKSGYRYQSAAFVRSYKLAGISVLDELLSYCDTNKDNISEWKGSLQAAKYEKMLIKNGFEFNSYLKLKHPQITYQQLLVDMEDVELILFAKCFGVNYPVLKSRTNTEAFSDTEKDLLELLKRTLANAAMCRAIPKLSISVEDDGIMSVAMDDAHDKSTSKAELQTINKYQQSLEATANEYLSLCKSKFDALVVAEPTIYISITPTTNLKLIDNSGFGSVFAM